MKKYAILAAVLFSGILVAQKTKPVLKIVEQKIKATYYHENGKVQQEEFFKEGKLEGAWSAFDEAGNKKATGTYANGEKTGKWFFWNGSELKEVDYFDDHIVSVKNWKQDAIVNRN